MVNPTYSASLFTCKIIVTPLATFVYSPSEPGHLDHNATDSTVCIAKVSLEVTIRSADTSRTAMQRAAVSDVSDNMKFSMI